MASSPSQARARRSSAISTMDQAPAQPMSVACGASPGRTRRTWLGSVQAASGTVRSLANTPTSKAPPPAGSG
ncbi:hypothetical protein G6O69_38050 [Pseudenhygromyxa sp. WMMC2535]|uniref:hypothetical protein n=1 Tax=Pseudenhygromyxa sp. WMMC2535 TaxID=2712867 RepID=UPI001594EE2F|nr:hypothetical protein [Pseudenhygromyxa sp. WMMC2535]NVB43674.1 hypothetical protein [Pseudenhygromyxa sp. WMMC2535]